MSNQPPPPPSSSAPPPPPPSFSEPPPPPPPDDVPVSSQKSLPEILKKLNVPIIQKSTTKQLSTNMLIKEKPVFISKEERLKLKQQEALEKRKRQVMELKQQKQSSATESTTEPIINESDLKEIQKRYLGLNEREKKKKQRRLGEKKFNEDWDPKEDTSQSDPLYKDRYQNIMFGRGQIGGTKLSALPETNEEQQLAYLPWREKPLEKMSKRDWRIFNEEFQIAAEGGQIPNGLRFWEESQLPKDILTTIERVGYKEPTPIQRQSIPISLEGRDLIGLAETGSGKTCAFLLPMLTQIMRLPKISEQTAMEGPYALILAPTRELAQQIETETRKFILPLGYRSISLIGGHSIDQQAFLLGSGIEIIIATPGRLRDCLEQRMLVLNRALYVVLDEADRMIELGFEEDLLFILEQLPAKRQMTMFSATMPHQVEKLAKSYLTKPAIVRIGVVGKAVQSVTQQIEMLTSNKKREKLFQLLSRRDLKPPFIVFMNQKDHVDELGRVLEKEGFRVSCLHGGKNQQQREIALQQIRDGRRDILVSTDVAGRGIDIPNVSLVINYDMPKNIESYLHRIGRTGRAGQSGLAVSFVTAEDSYIYYDLKKVLVQSKCKIPQALLQHEASRYRLQQQQYNKQKEETEEVEEPVNEVDYMNYQYY